MIVLGFSGIENGAYYQTRYGLRFVGHDAAVALVVDGKLVFAAEEERFSRQKHTSELPAGAFRAALRHAGVSATDLDLLAYTWKVSPGKFLNMNLHHVPHVPLCHAPQMALAGFRVIRDMMSPRRIAAQFGRRLGVALPPCRGVAHHLGHVASAYYPSPFEEAAALSIDGQGEDESGTLGEWRGTDYRKLQAVRSPNSIGILYGMVTDFLGMRAAWDEYKVMGMSAYGDPSRFREQLGRLVTLLPGGRYRTHRTAMVFRPGYCDRMLERVLGIPPRRPEEPLADVHFDLAAAMQQTTEDVVFHLLRHLRALSSSRNLCLSGGVFQNSVINGRIRSSGLFDHVHVPPVPGDHGGAMGAALHLYHQVTRAPRADVGFEVFAGPDIAEHEVLAVLKEHASALQWHRCEDVAAEAAGRLSRGEVLGWVQGRMEYGPRALGHRSILADPRRVDMRDRVNARVKHREEFRPFAGSVPAERACELFEIEGTSPYMQFVVAVREHAQARIPAVVHHGTCRVQTVEQKVDPLFHRLLTCFGERTGTPVLLNTSFNDADEPIVCTAADAVRTFLRTDLDALVVGTYLALRSGSTRPEVDAPRP